MQPLSMKRFWFYNDWEIEPRDKGQSLWNWLRVSFTGSDEYGHHTAVVPLGKGRAIVLVYRAGYKGWRFCEFCALSRRQTLEFEQEALYAQTYFNLEDYDDVYDLENWEWNQALGIA